MLNRDLLRECIAGQVQGMDFQRVYRIIIKPSGLWNGSSPLTDRIDGATLQQVELIDHSLLIYNTKTDEWNHEQP
jgi:hypothetical protein